MLLKITMHMKNVSMGDRHSIAVKCPHCNAKDVASNPAATRNENGHWDGPLHRR